MKKTLAVFLSVLMLVSLCLPAGALELESVESAAEESIPATVSSDEDVQLTAVGSFAPGLNSVNGKSTAETFEDWTADQASVISSKAATTRSIGVSPVNVEGHAADKSVIITRTSSASSDAYPQFIIYGRMEQGRKYYLAFNLYSNQTLLGEKGTKNLWLMNESGATVVSVLGSDFTAAVDAGKWYSYSNKSLEWQIDSCGAVVLQGKATKTNSTSSFPDPSTVTGDFTWYLDDVMLMPYYKVSYIDVDGSVFSSEQFLFDESDEIATSYIPLTDKYPEWSSSDGSVKTCIGWSTQQNATEPMESVTLTNEDVMLYPVWRTESEGILSADNEVASAVTGTTVTVTAARDVTNWVIDVGNTEAAYEIGQNTVTITAAGYAGEITVSAYTDGAEEPAVKVIRLFSGEKWKPGLNTITGTVSAFDFELADADVFSKVLNGTNIGSSSTASRWHITINPVVAGVNTSLSAAYVDYQFTYLRPAVEYATPIEKERPLDYSFDVLSSDTLYTMVNGAGGGTTGNIYSENRGSGATTAWKHEHITVDISKDTCTSNLADNKAKDGIKWLGSGSKAGTFADSFSGKYLYMDNLSYIPYYKITYIGLDGVTEEGADYVLFDAEGNFLTAYTPDNSFVSGATGFSLEPNGARVTSVPLEHKDITLYASAAQEIHYPGVSIAVEGDSYTIPTPEEIGVEAEHFLVWLDNAGNKYYAGTLVEGEALTALIGKLLTPYCQDASLPAMGIAFEGGKSANNVNISKISDSKTTYVEYMEDDGRDVLHVHTYKSTAGGTDTRIAVITSSMMNANEYNIIQYMYKVNALADGSLNPQESAELKIFYHNTLGDGFYCSNTNVAATGCSGEHRPTGRYDAVVSQEYQLLEIDMGLAENNPAVHGWNASGKIYSLHLDPAKVVTAGLQDTYIDYLRVYRDGIFTVTYDTNAPEGCEELVKNEVEPDTGRGAGTGYLLKGERPVMEEFVFRGWALTPDATPEEVIESVDLTGDLTVYAVWSEAYPYQSPTTEDVAGIRSGADGINGIRFRAHVSAEVKECLDEYGFIVAREDVLGENELTFAFKAEDANKPLYVSGAAYSKADNVDIQYAVDAQGVTTFTAVCIGIPEAHYNTPIVVRTYAKYSNKNGLSFTLYGDTVKRSIAQVAQSIKDAGGEEYTNNQEYIDSILGA